MRQHLLMKLWITRKNNSVGLIWQDLKDQSLDLRRNVRNPALNSSWVIVDFFFVNLWLFWILLSDSLLILPAEEPTH